MIEYLTVWEEEKLLLLGLLFNTSLSTGKIIYTIMSSFNYTPHIGATKYIVWVQIRTEQLIEILPKWQYPNHWAAIFLDKMCHNMLL